jgi:hypothetical protein
LEDAIQHAGHCKLPTGKKHPHQYRIRASILAEAEQRLQASAAEIRECRTFDALHRLVQDRIALLDGIGPLTVYDIANHVGAHLGLEPELVYLHRGTAAGAKALGLNHRLDTLEPGALPAAFRQLSPREAEDCLCLYKDDLETIYINSR